MLAASQPDKNSIVKCKDVSMMFDISTFEMVKRP